MKIVAAVLLLACAVSGQLIGYGALPYAYNSLPVALKSTPYAYNTFTPYAYAAPVAPLTTSSQYHAQDELGQASFGYAHPGQAAANYRDAFGNQVGSYAYINPDGKEVKVSYVADSLGFRVLSNDLPVAPVAAPVEPLPMPIPVADTVEVVEARNAHLAAVEAAKSGVVVAAPVPVAVAELPAPVQDTPEVVAAKAEHAAAHAAAKAAADAAPDRKKRQVYVAPTLGLGLRATLPLAYSAPVVAAPTAYTTGTVISAPAVRDATLTNIVHTPGHAVSYRVD